MNEVWPKPINLGREFRKIKCFIKRMLEYCTWDEWDDSFHNVRQLIIDNHNMVEKLTKI